jgi:hypothetical protein
MPDKDSPTLREEYRRLSQSVARTSSLGGPSVDNGKSKDQLQAEEEGKAQTLSRPGGFRNDPDDPTNPNEVRERYLIKLREMTLRLTR